MGDSFGSKGMLGTAEEVRELHPGTYVPSVYIKDDNEGDQKAGFVCHSLSIGINTNVGMLILSTVRTCRPTNSHSG
jgi:hypothetical protein